MHACSKAVFVNHAQLFFTEVFRLPVHINWKSVVACARFPVSLVCIVSFFKVHVAQSNSVYEAIIEQILTDLQYRRHSCSTSQHMKNRKHSCACLSRFQIFIDSQPESLTTSTRAQESMEL